MYNWYRSIFNYVINIISIINKIIMIKQYSWVFLSFFAMFCTSISIILLKFIQETNLNILMTLIIGYLLLSVFCIIYILNNLVIFKETIYKF